eukprot:CAMPEP_0113829170 /NCGR_PEP_ID=MMETSP0328-20130328/5659_1 /TAXON_ID=39455 /ORGANISM="Alexandrium minutum" /LENGTH=68 /DNA_ID=CAMNT_0000797211 /DNA_START=566 /DNA_END=768 /DNA_ORIENTATION=- /assembly_acc=CAM_ASM_000350
MTPEDPIALPSWRTPKTPLIAQYLNTAVEGTGSQGSQQAVHELASASGPKVVDIEPHGSAALRLCLGR